MNKKKGIYNLFVVCGIEFLIFQIGMKCIEAIFNNIMYPAIVNIQDEKLLEFMYWTGYCSLFLIPSAIILIYMRVTDYKILSSFVPKKGFKSAFLIGSVLGAVINLICVLFAVITGSIKLTYSGFTPLVIFMVLFCFFTCSCEELLCRGFVFEYLKKQYPIEVASAAGSVLFVLHHISNMTIFGFNPYFAFNIFLFGLHFVLIIELTGSIWAAFSFHTLWNFTEQFLVGIPNSGASSSISIFKGESCLAGFFFDSTYGVEGAPGATIVFIIILAILFLLLKRVEAIDK